ncbi:DUF4249 domain-containing protein [Muricauda sp. SCSIO 64092]|uniref:DUF4249 family protein n=1 Tax=Allomuricauda sp. SCSIO 64092 TaxID=2908842 RepID=UPI001FF5CBAF|nr:DUF4249 family protein [Muricauda sp. SCSIO 64092]UOY05798.1 DUF4249 domain-containing protein [Muricauda sp. SCSIO 64092]
MKKHLILLFALSILFGCEDVVDSGVVEIDQTIHIAGFISPENDTLSVNISRALPALGLELSFDDPRPDMERFIVRDAEVTIENSTGSNIRLPFLEDELLYAESAETFEVLPGETYTLKVSANGQNYSATCIVPLHNIDGISEQIREDTNEFGFNEFDLDMSFMDIEGEDNFYFVGAFLEVTADDESISNTIRNIFFDLEAFQTDNLRDGLEIGASTYFFPALSFDENNEVLFLEQDLVLQVITAEQSLFQLLRAGYLNETNDGNPFIELGVEPNTINGNGATGVFAGYRYFEKRVVITEE